MGDAIGREDWKKNRKWGVKIMQCGTWGGGGIRIGVGAGEMCTMRFRMLEWVCKVSGGYSERVRGLRLIFLGCELGK